MIKIELKSWIRANYSPPPSPRTILKRIDRGEIDQQYVKEGRTYYIVINDHWADKVVRELA